MFLDINNPKVQLVVLPLINQLNAMMALPWYQQALPWNAMYIMNLTNALNTFGYWSDWFTRAQGGYQLPAKRPPTVCG